MTRNSINNTSSDLIVSNLNLTGSTISTTSANSNLILAPNGTGQVLAPGISFDSGTNILDTYIGYTTYTPTISFGGASVGITYSTQLGRYTRIGDLVFFSLYIILTSKGSSVGNASISLPITASATYTQVLPATFGDVDYTISQPCDFVVFSLPTATFVGIVNNANTYTLTNTSFSNTSQISVTGTYLVE
jgi:hypothetical protein